MSITNTGWVLWWHQTSHRNRVTIKVALGTPKVLVEAHGWRVGFVHPNDGEIYSRPSRWYHIDTACKHVTRSQGCHITERVKSTCRKQIGRAHVWTPVTAHYLVCRLLLEKKCFMKMARVFRSWTLDVVNNGITSLGEWFDEDTPKLDIAMRSSL